MSFAVDANLLLYASDLGSARQPLAARRLERLAEGPDIVYLFWPVLMAYLRVATHPSVFTSPLDPEAALQNVRALTRLPHSRCPGEKPGFLETFEAVASGQSIRGNLVPDAHIVALMRQHGVSEIWSDDRGLRRFDGIRVRALDDPA